LKNVLPTRELAMLIEASEASLLQAFVDAGRRMRPEASFQTIDVAGGVAAFMGVSSPLSMTTSLGLTNGIDAGEIDRVTHFYHDRGAPARVWVNPLADPSVERLLAKAGYLPIGRNNALAIELSANGFARDARIVEEPDANAWGRISARGFLDRYEGEDEGAFLASTIASGKDVIALTAFENGEAVATGAMIVQGELASLFAGSTLTEHRGEGLHRALVADRLARAREGGARYARTSAPIGSPSEANFRAAGMTVLYTRTLWERAQRPA
jgi:hypothetical protein